MFCAALTACAHPHSTAETGSVLTDGYADVNGIRLHYVTQGSGPLILFLHGMPEFWYAWRAQLPEFSRDHQAVAVDMPGYNLSSKPAELEAYEVRQLVEDVRGLADHLGARKFVLVGHDWGGIIAWYFAIAHPDRLDKLIVINAPHPAIFARELAQNPAQQQASQYMLLFNSPAAESTYAARNYARPLGSLSNLLPPGKFTHEDSVQYLASWSHSGGLTGGFNYYRAAHLRPAGSGQVPWTPPEVGRADMIVSVPTLVIWGERDRFLLTGNLNGLDAYVPNLLVKRIPDGSHWVLHERPAEVNALIREFIQ